MLLDIVILPSVELRRKIGGRIKEAVAGYSHVFVVDNKRLIPHLSLWHVKTSKNRIDSLIKALTKIVKNQKPVKIESLGARICKIPKECFVIDVRNSKSLISLRQKVFRTAYPLKTGIMPPWKPYTGKTLREAEKYGRLLKFHPSFTAGLLKKKEDAFKLVKALKKFSFNFWAKEIYICEVNKWWQVTKIIRRIAFSKQV